MQLQGDKLTGFWKQVFLTHAVVIQYFKGGCIDPLFFNKSVVQLFSCNYAVFWSMVERAPRDKATYHMWHCWQRQEYLGDLFPHLLLEVEPSDQVRSGAPRCEPSNLWSTWASCHQQQDRQDKTQWAKTGLQGSSLHRNCWKVSKSTGGRKQHL